MTGDCHAPFRGSPGVQVPRATRLVSRCLASFRPPCLRAVDRSRGRGGAPAAQRGQTTLRPTRIRRILLVAGTEAKTLWFKSSAASRECAVGARRCACRRPALSGSTDEVRRHDDGWGARRAGCRRGVVAQSLRGVHPTARRWRQANCGSWPQASAELWAGHARTAWLVSLDFSRKSA